MRSKKIPQSQHIDKLKIEPVLYHPDELPYKPGSVLDNTDQDPNHQFGIHYCRLEFKFSTDSENAAPKFILTDHPTSTIKALSDHMLRHNLKYPISVQLIREHYLTKKQDCIEFL